MSRQSHGYPTTAQPRSRLHVIGPLPPPLGGATVNFDLLVSELKLHAVPLGIESLRVTDTCPRRLRTMHVLDLNTVARQARILAALAMSPARSESVLFVGSERQFLAAAPMFLAARAAGRPVVVKFIGNSLSQFLRSLPGPARWTMLTALNSMNAVLCQTQAMLKEVRALGVSNALQSPGYRRVNWDALPEPPMHPRHPGELRLVHLGLVSESKGVHNVLRALAQLDRKDVFFDMYGQVPPAERSTFDALLSKVPRAAYKGSWNGDPTALLAGYDALVLATFHSGEGHPGSLVEAMAAATPVLASNFQAIPELITDGENGLLVPPRDVPALVHAMARLADHPDERLRLGRAHRRRLPEHDVRKGVEVILAALELPS